MQLFEGWKAGLYPASKRMALNGNPTSHFKYSFELGNGMHSPFLIITPFLFFFLFVFSSEAIYFCLSVVSPSLSTMKIYIRNKDIKIQERKEGTNPTDMDSLANTFTGLIFLFYFCSVF